MLIFGSYRSCLKAARPNRENVFLNLSSLTMYIPRLNYLLPNLQINNPNLYSDYVNYLSMNELAFSQLMSIMMPLYEGKDVYICITNNSSEVYVSIMNEMLESYIRDRYGYITAYINEPEDLDYFNESEFCFSVQGIMLMDQDRERYVIMMEKSRLQSGGFPYA